MEPTISRRLIPLLVAALSPQGSARADGASARSDGDETGPYDCALIEDNLRDEIRRAVAPIQLSETPRHGRDQQLEGEQCDGFGPVRRALGGRPRRDIERGLLGERQAAVRSVGPTGSGHYWDVTLAVEGEGKVLGACLTTVTTGWRNVAPIFGRYFPAWRLLDGGAFVLWTAIESTPTGALYQQLLLPLVYRLDGDALALDGEATTREVARFGRIYARAATDRRDPEKALHRAAAAAYLAFAEGKSCPTATPPPEPARAR